MRQGSEFWDQEYIRKDKRKESSEANSAWDVAKLAVFKQPAWYQSDCSKIMHFRQQMAPKSTIYPALWRPLYPVFGTFNEKILRTFGIFFRIWGFWWAHLIRNFTRISEIFKFCLYDQNWRTYWQKTGLFFDSFFDSLLTTAVFTQNKAVAKHTVLKSKNIVQKLVSLFLFKVTENDSICH